MNRRSARIQAQCITNIDLINAIGNTDENIDDDFVDDGEEEVFDDETDSEIDDIEDFAANNADSDNESPDEEIEINTDNESQFYLGKDQTQWMSTPTNARTYNRISRITFNIVNTPENVRVDTASDCFRLIFKDEVMDIIVRFTNMEARKHKTNWKDTDNIEIMAFIGLLYTAGVERASKRNYREFYGGLRGLPIFKACMSRNRFQDILRFIRFDDKAPIRELSDLVINNLKNSYNPGEFLTIDEQLVPFRGRCSFKKYIPSKPDEYGMKIFWICDATNWYPLNAIIYLGKYDLSRSIASYNKYCLLEFD